MKSILKGKAIRKQMILVKKKVLDSNDSKLRRLVWDLEEMLENSEKIKDAYQDENGVYRWKSSNNVPFDDMLECWDLDDETLAKCKAARESDNKKSIAAYKKRMENYEPSDEELFEMRAAFGEGETVVNVITGKEIKL